MRLYFFTIIFLLNFYCYGQSNDKWRAGSALSLTGKTYVLTVFISEKEWRYDEKLKIINEVYGAEGWLVGQAKNYGKSISFMGGNYGLVETVIMDNIVSGTASGNEPKGIVSSVLKKIGYSNSMQFVDWVKKNTNCSNSLVLIIANKDGIGYALPYSTNMDQEKYFLEGSIVYKNYSVNLPLCSSQIAHEILHLFSAWDLYKTLDQGKDREYKAKQIFPNDVMLRVSYDINELKVDKLTAWLVGLSSYSEDRYEWFRPNYARNSKVRGFFEWFFDWRNF